MSNSLPPHGLYSPWDSPGQNTGMGSLSILQGIFPPHGSNPCLWHCRRILYQLSQQGSPRILEWAAYPFSRGSSRPRSRIGVSCTAGGCFTSPGVESGSPALQADALPAQESNRGLLHRRRMLYRLSYRKAQCRHILPLF